MILPKDWLKQIRRVELHARLTSEQLMAGYHGSVFKGRGMDFDSVREYQPGDDVRRIDWNVSNRMRKTFVKRYVEERELVVILMVDVSASGMFGTTGVTKRDVAAEVTATLAFSAVRSSDRVGLLLFSDVIEQFIPPRKTRQHVLRLIRELLFRPARSERTSLKNALLFLNRVVHRPALVFVISDFLDEGYEQMLKAANQRHEIVALQIADPREECLPDVGLALVRDAETGEVMEINTADQQLREAFAAVAGGRRETMRNFFVRSQIGSIEIRTDRPFANELRTFLDNRAGRRIA